MRGQFAGRYLTLAFLLGIFGTGIIFQLVRIQTSPEAQAILVDVGPYTGAWRTYYPARGEIYDRNGNLLAGNQTVYEVGVTLSEIDDPHSIALATSVYLGLDYDEVYEQITDPPEGIFYIVLTDYITPDRADQLIQLQEVLLNDPSGQSLDGLVFQPHLQRSYPEGSLVSNVVGFVTREGRGYYGIEEKYNNLLAGVPVTVWVPSDPNRAEELPDIPPGATLILTIDREIQAATEDVLDSSIQTYGADSGTIIVMDPQTGEILSMATTPRMDPNHYSDYATIFPGETPYNRAISQAYEPGSVMKIFTMAGALDSGTVTPETTMFDSGVIWVGGWDIHNWDGGAWGYQTMTGCLQHSLNVCLAWVAVEMGNDNFYAYFENFGFGHLTGIDLAGEAPGRLKRPGDGDWYQVDLGTNAFGQGIAATPIQVIAAASAIANQGRMVSPHVLYAMVQNGQQHNMSTQIIGRPISTETARTLTAMLAVSLQSESSLALVPGYSLAGKTGTAQIPTVGGYDLHQTNASFVGWGPVDDPQFLVYIWLERPTASPWASEVAAPVFRQMVERLVVLMNIPPDAIRLATNGQ
ncbi:MAG: penicillin-binding protein 2 [Anaerolineales bacterium]|nr:penicillin-binding protein 2 [Anaerolineales bacterium]